MLDEVQIERFVARIQKMDSCWLWLGQKTASGYGRVSLRARGHGCKQAAHRIAYSLWKEQIPDDLVLDHLCRNRLCVNPDHLEAVTIGENIRRGLTGQFPRSAVHNEKIAAAKRGKPRPWTPEWIAKREAGRLKAVATWRGRKMTNEQRQKMRDAWARRKASAA